MAFQTSVMTQSHRRSKLTLQSQLSSRLALLFLLVTSTALGLDLLFRLRPGAVLFNQYFLSDTALGLVSGFGARFLLRDRHSFIRVLSAAASFFIGLLLLGLSSGWRLGIGPLEFWSTAFNWVEIANVLIGVGTLLLALLAWQGHTISVPRRRRAVTPEPTPEPEPEPVVSSPSPDRPSLWSRIRALPRVAISPTPPHPTPRPRTRTRRSTALRVARQPKTAVQQSPWPRWQGFKRKSKLQVSAEEDHLCPYCLEAVLPNDPRGIVECKICHTKHHEDCWEIAGSCQVPHYNA